MPAPLQNKNKNSKRVEETENTPDSSFRNLMEVEQELSPGSWEVGSGSV